MGELSSEQALNGIFNILQTMITQQNEQKEKQDKGETDDKVKNLINGLIKANDNKQTEAVGQQLEKLAKGIQDLAAIDEQKLNTVSAVVQNITNLFGSLKIDNNTEKNIDTFFNIFKKFAELNEESSQGLAKFMQNLALQNSEDIQKGLVAFVNSIQVMDMLTKVDIDKAIKKIEKLDNANVGEKIANFITNIGKHLDKIQNSAELSNTVNNINNIFGGLASIINTNIWNMKLNLSSFNAWLLGRRISKFINAITKGINTKEIDSSIQYITELLKPLAQLTDERNKNGLTHLRKALNKKLAKSIANFFITLVDELEKADPKKLETYTLSISQFLFAFSSDKFNFEEIKSKLTKDNAKEIAAFFVTLNKELKKIKNVNKFKKNVEAMAIILNSFNHDLMGAAIAVSVGSKFLSIKSAQKITTFIETLVSGDFNPKKVKAAQEFIKGFGKFLMSLVITFGLIVLIVTIAPITSVIAGLMIMKFGIDFIKKTIIDLVSEISDKDVKSSSKIISQMSQMIAITMLMIGFIAIITSTFGIIPVITGLAVMMVTLYGISAFVKKLSDTKFNKSLKDSMKALNSITILILGVTASIALLTIISTVTSFEDVFGAFVIVTLVVASMIGIVWALNKIMKDKNNNIEGAIDALKMLTIMFLAISLITAFILPKIAENWEDTLIGAAITIGIIGIMVGITYLLSKIKRDNLQQATLTISVLTIILLAVSIIALTILPKIADNWEDTIKGAGVVAIIMLGLVGITYLLGKLDSKDLMQGIIAMSVLTVILLAVSIIALTILPKLADKWKEIAIGAAITLGIIVLMSVIVIGLSWLIKSGSGKDLLYATASLIIMGVILFGIAYITKEFLIPLGKQSGEALWGAAQIALIILGMTGIMIVLGKLVDKFATYAAMGAVTLVAITGILWLISKMLDPFIDLSIKMHENAGAIWSGSAQICALLTAVGLVMAGIGLLIAGPQVLFVLAGAATIVGIAGILYLITDIVNNYIDVSKLANKISNKEIESTNEKITTLIKGIKEVISDLSGNFFTSLGSGITLLPLYGAIKLLFNMIIYAIKNIKFVNAQITIDDMVKFNNLIWQDKENSLLGSLQNILNKFNALDGVAKAVIISMAIRPIIDTLSKWIDVIMKVAKGAYVIGYDKNGKPIYEHLKASDFGAAATEVSNNFSLFLEKLQEGFGKLKLTTTIFMTLVSNTIGKVINVVSKFVDVVMKVATGTYIKGYDSNGKPIYEHITADEFGKAGTQVSLRFAEFLEALNTGFNKLTDKAIDTMERVRFTMYPVLSLVSKFVDIVMKVATGTYISGYDENGNAMYEHISATEFGDAGKAVSEQFKIFLDNLDKGFKQISSNAIDAMKQMKKVMSPIMEMVSAYVDSVIKVVSAQIITGYDKDGKPQYEPLDIDKFESAGMIISEQFGNFITQLSNSINGLTDEKEDALKAISKTMSPIMDSVSKFVDAIIKMASGQYIDRYDKDKDGNFTVPHFAKIDNNQMILAAVTISKTFGMFIDELTRNFDTTGEGWFSDGKTEKALKAIKDSIQPIFDSVGVYVEAIMKVATGQYIDHYDKDKDGKAYPIYKHLDITQFKKAAETVAEMFAGFVDTLITKFNDEEFKEKATQVSDIINESISPVMEAFKNFSEALMPFFGIKTGNKEDDKLVVLMQGSTQGKTKIEEISAGIANAYVNFVKTIVDYISNETFKKNVNDIKDTATKVNELINIVKKTTNDLASINKVFNKEASEGTNNMSQQMQDNAVAFSNVINIYKQYFTQLSQYSFADAITSANDCLSFMKNVKKISNEFNNIIKNINNENAEELTNKFLAVLNNLSDNITKISNQTVNIDITIPEQILTSFYKLSVLYTRTVDMLKDTDYDAVRKFTDSLLNVMQQFKIINGEVNNTDLLAGVTRFSESLYKLSQDDIIIQGSSSLELYTLHLKTFTKQVINTESHLTVYIKTLQKATKALKELDEVLINQSKAREDAVQRFADKIDNVTKAFARMSKTFDEFDKSALAQRFDEFRAILAAAGIDYEEEQYGYEQPNGGEQGNPNQGGNTTNYNNTYNNRGNTGLRRGNITVQFANKVLSGTYSTT